MLQYFPALHQFNKVVRYGTNVAKARSVGVAPMGMRTLHSSQNVKVVTLLSFLIMTGIKFMHLIRLRFENIMARPTKHAHSNIFCQRLKKWSLREMMHMQRFTPTRKKFRGWQLN